MRPGGHAWPSVNFERIIMDEKYDSTEDTQKHRARVRKLICSCMMNLFERAAIHDASKLETPEKEIFDEMTPKLKASTYGSDEYKSFLASMKPALDHHYANNRHHPEHYEKAECAICFSPEPEGNTTFCQKCGNAAFVKQNPVLDGMSLLDILEMLCDWKAAGERHANGTIERSLTVNRERFKIGDQLFHILENTVNELEWL